MFSGAVGQLAFSASAAVVAKGKNFVANCQTNSIWKHTRSCHWFFTRRQRNIPFIVKLIFLLLNLGYDCEELR